MAAVWIAAGVAALVFGLLRAHWIPVVLAPLAIGYGIIWVRVARTGRQLQWPRRRDRIPY
ncbi:MAG TPA: hypothetical protein VE756_12275 [Burkholderiales bacterium]|nr:hypothetical protein [Burkholderiales bacterium]